jgi:hypothetical protein
MHSCSQHATLTFLRLRPAYCREIVPKIEDKLASIRCCRTCLACLIASSSICYRPKSFDSLKRSHGFIVSLRSACAQSLLACCCRDHTRVSLPRRSMLQTYSGKTEITTRTMRTLTCVDSATSNCTEALLTSDPTCTPGQEVDAG